MFTVETCGLTTIDTVLEVTTGGVIAPDTGCNYNLATQLVSDDDFCGSQSKTPSFSVAAGTVTYVKLREYNDNCGGSVQVRLTGGQAAGPPWYMR